MLLPDPDVLEALGLDRQAGLRELESCAAPQGRTGHGFLAAQAQPLPELAAGALVENWALSSLDLPRFRERVPGGTIARWDYQPAVLVIQVEGGEIVFGKGASALDEGMVVLDSRDGEAFLRVRGSSGEVLVGARQGDVTILAIEPALSPELDELSRWQPTPTLEISAPPLDRLLHEAPIAPWLRASYERLRGAPSAFARAAAPGLVARLWSPPLGTPKAERQRLLDAVAAGEGPVAQAERFFEALSEQAKGELLELALLRADRLSDHLNHLATRIAEDPGGASPEVLAFAHARDDLESLAFLFRRCSPAPSLEDALAGLDAEAAAQMTLWSAVEAFDADPRLAEVSWQEPSSWWGLLAHAD